MIIMGKSFFLISSVSVSSRFSEMCLPQAKIGRFHSRAPASMQIYWSKRKRLHKKRVQLPQDWSGTPTWPPFHCVGTPIWPPWVHVETL